MTASPRHRATTTQQLRLAPWLTAVLIAVVLLVLAVVALVVLL